MLGSQAPAHLKSAQKIVVINPEIPLSVGVFGRYSCVPVVPFVLESALLKTKPGGFVNFGNDKKSPETVRFKGHLF